MGGFLCCEKCLLHPLKRQLNILVQFYLVEVCQDMLVIASHIVKFYSNICKICKFPGFLREVKVSWKASATGASTFFFDDFVINLDLLLFWTYVIRQITFARVRVLFWTSLAWPSQVSQVTPLLQMLAWIKMSDEQVMSKGQTNINDQLINCCDITIYTWMTS